MGVIDDYVADYERQFDYWEGVARQARTLLQEALHSAGVRAITTSRAKAVDRLAGKVRARDVERRYASPEEITDDIVDLAGVRVSLYFPGQMAEAADIIRALFDVQEERTFPKPPQNAERSETDDAPKARRADTPASASRNAPGTGENTRPYGYRAQHFRVQIPEDLLSRNDARFASATVEIQVASVLMHAWSEVEHDLSYKPGEATLSKREQKLLRQLNNLVADGENNLTRLQAAIDRRVEDASGPFRDHYELAEYLRGYRAHNLPASASGLPLGQVDLLFDFLQHQERASADQLAPYLAQLAEESDERPLAEQVIDLLVAGDAEQYLAYRTTSVEGHTRPTRRTSRRSGRQAEAELYENTFERFLNTWAEFERTLAACLAAEGIGGRRHTVTRNTRAALQAGYLDDETAIAVGELQDMRNRLVHNSAVVPTGKARIIQTERIASADAYLRRVIGNLAASAQAP